MPGREAEQAVAAHCPEAWLSRSRQSLIPDASTGWLDANDE